MPSVIKMFVEFMPLAKQQIQGYVVFLSSFCSKIQT